MRLPTATEPRHQYEAFPAELRELRQWVCWRLVTLPNGRLTKEPFIAQKSVMHAKSSVPSTWRSFEQAVSASEHHNGVGFMFSADDPYVGVDLDHVRNPETGDVLPWAQQVLEDLNSYTEVSQSGEGFHVIVRGRLPGKGRKRPALRVGLSEDPEDKSEIEIYDRTRFFVVTGDHVEGTPATIEDRAETVVALWERMGTRRARGETRATGDGLEPRASTLGLVLDPAAEAPRKIIDLVQGNQRFLHTWNGSRKDLAKADGTLDGSRYDYNLARFALDAGWTPQEVADLIIEFRRRHNLDLAKALRDDYIARTLEEVRQERSTSGVLGQLPFDVTRFIQYGSEAPSFDLTVSDPQTGETKVVTFSEPAQLLSKRRAAEVLFAAGYALPKSALNSWDRITAALLPIKEVETTVTTEEIWRGFIAEYFHRNRPSFKFDSSTTPFATACRDLEAERFFFAIDEHEGTIWMRLERFVAFVADAALDRRATFKTIGAQLRRIGFDKRLLRIGQDQVKANIWVSPPGFVREDPGVAADAVVDLEAWKHVHRGGMA